MAFPTSIEAAEYFQVAYDNLSTTLTQQFNSADTVAYVSSTENFPSLGFFTVEDDICSYTGKTAYSFTGVTHGVGGTTPADHASGKVVSLTLTATAWNRVVAEFRAALTKIGVNSSADTSSIDYRVNQLENNTGGIWFPVLGTPTRTSDSQFEITDTANANKYDKLFCKGTILKWDEAGTFQWAIVKSASYNSDKVTIDILGDSLTAGFSDMKYCVHKAMMETFIIAGTLAIGNDLAKTFYNPYPICVFSCDAYVKTAGTTNSTAFDINDDGASLFGDTAASIASAGTSDIDNVASNVETVVAAGSKITVDITAVTTTAPVEAYIYLFYCPESWRYHG